MDECSGYHFRWWNILYICRAPGKFRDVMITTSSAEWTLTSSEISAILNCSYCGTPRTKNNYTSEVRDKRQTHRYIYAVLADECTTWSAVSTKTHSLSSRDISPTISCPVRLLGKIDMFSLQNVSFWWLAITIHDLCRRSQLWYPYRMISHSRKWCNRCSETG